MNMVRPALCLFVFAVAGDHVLAADAKPFVYGYANKLSVTPGEELSFHLSTNSGSVNIKISRLGAKDEQLWEKRNVVCAQQPMWLQLASWQSRRYTH